MNDNLVRWNDFDEIEKEIKEYREKRVNTYLVGGYYYLTDDERAKRDFSVIVLAKSAEEAMTILKSIYPYRDRARIDRVELRDSDIIVGKDNEK